MIEARVIRPKGKVFNAPAMRRVVENGLSAAARGARVDFNVTTRTWSTRPEFVIEKVKDGRAIFTKSEIYGYVNDGTPAHQIRPKNGKVLVFGGPGFKAKTSPGVIGSKAGRKGKGTIITPKPVQHPGTQARNFAKTIAAKWQTQLPKILQAQISRVPKEKKG